jgi:uncharacterized damage-inducible protein DinB
MTTDSGIRNQLAAMLAWKDAHVDFDAAVAGIPAEVRGTRPANLPHSLWEVVEHLRLAQHDILDFCLNPGYEEMTWPDDYWPSTQEPPGESSWEKSLAQYREDRARLQKMAGDPAVDLTARIPHGQGQTYLRELLLVADHAAYHVGELIVLRRLLGVWP